MPKNSENPGASPKQGILIELPKVEGTSGLTFKPLATPVWTENKARFIQRYLFNFIQVTKHCTYIDGFAGPQEAARHDMWSAKLVLETEPFWIQRFHLCELHPQSIRALKKLKQQQPTFDSRNRPVKRTIEVWPGDFNTTVNKLLNPSDVPLQKATFCLLDQRTFECRWETVKALADYKRKEKNKIELFYFLAINWLHRSFSGLTKHPEKAALWWGNDGWQELRLLSQDKVRDAMVERFSRELGYTYVTPWPIFQRRDAEVIMYYMIHATDHPEAPHLMARAYAKAVRPLSKSEQIKIKWD